MGIDKNLVQGSMALLLLRLLETKDMYGYEMIEALRSKSNNVFELKAGTLYPLLHSLESKGYVMSYEDASSGKKRRYYQLTEAGRHHSSEKKTGMDDLSVGSHQCTEYGRRMLGWMKKSTCRRSESRS